VVSSVSGNTVNFSNMVKYHYDGSVGSEFRNLISKFPSALDFYTNNGQRPNVTTYPYMGLVKVTPRRNVRITNFTFEKPNGSTIGNQGVFLLGTMNCKVDNCIFHDCVIWNMDSQDNQFIGNTIEGKTYFLYNWMANGCSGVVVKDNIFKESCLVLEEGGRDIRVSHNQFDLTNYMQSCIFVSNLAEDITIDNTNRFIHRGNNAIDVEDMLGVLSIYDSYSDGYSIFARIQNNQKLIFTTTLNIRRNTAFSKVNYNLQINLYKQNTDAGDLSGYVVDNALSGQVGFQSVQPTNVYIKNIESGLIVNRTPQSSLISKGSYFIGDIINIDGAVFRCSQAGNYNRNIVDITATTTANSNLVTVSAITDGTNTFRQGDIININGIAGNYKVTGINGSTLQVTPNIPNAVTSSSCFLSGSPTFTQL
jgi:hypothetical protein